jgi:hypothetical protein
LRRLSRAFLFVSAVLLTSPSLAQPETADEEREEAADTRGEFKHGRWEGRCYREGFLRGRDRELCKALTSPSRFRAGIEVERSAKRLTVSVLNGGNRCVREGGRGSLGASALAGRHRVAKLATLIERQVEKALDRCGATMTPPEIREADIAALLTETDGLKRGSFVPLDPKVRAPAAARCGRDLEQAWREALDAHPVPDRSSVHLLMYTFSRGGPKRADKRFEARPELMEGVVSFGMGPGGSMIVGSKSFQSWRDASSERFVVMCDLAIEAWSAFVELAVFPPADASSPIFAVRADTGVAASDGFMIGQGKPPLFRPAQAD